MKGLEVGLRSLGFATCSYFGKTLGLARLSFQECVVHNLAMESSGEFFKRCLERGRKPGICRPRRNLGEKGISPPAHPHGPLQGKEILHLLDMGGTRATGFILTINALVVDIISF